MKDTNSRLQVLLDLYFEDKATTLEKDELWDYVNDPIYIADLEILLVEAFKKDYQDEKGITTAQKDLILDKIFEGSKPVQKKNNILWLRIAAISAAAAIIVGVGLIYYKSKFTNPTLQTASKVDIVPGKVGATLTLSNGKKINLTNAIKGELAKEAGISISKNAEGQLVYEVKADENDINRVNTLTTANGQTYILILPDKSKAWINAASSLTYSASLMEGGVRKVKLKGEGYFEVTKDKVHPFIVESEGQEVEVLGTHFNISNYPDDKFVKTTLLEGSVRVIAKSTGNTQILKPGEQINIIGNSIQINQGVDLEEVIAWKNGYFKFNEGLESILTKLSRWYDVDIIYQTKISPELVFAAEISRSKSISDVLKVIEAAGNVHFKIEGRRVIVMK
ncbi:FecR family protein [Solitalea lacus]|uniref:FecR family protein n=1 Tax=Solitalea lacus TaxID=2911172 RepID=UPI001EDB1006|nr:FecR family protein [Solitalea lacus]UKJ07009.1 DUF4974 domain-containing protein [Solitalea lacus]